MDARQRLADRRDAIQTSRAKHPIVVLAVAAGNGFINEADLVEKRLPTDEDRALMDLHPAGAKEVAEP